MNLVLVIIHHIVSFPQFLITDVAVLGGMEILYMLVKTALSVERVITLTACPQMLLLDVRVHLGLADKELGAVWTGLLGVGCLDVVLNALHQLVAVFALVDNVQMLRHPAGLDHPHAELTPGLAILDIDSLRLVLLGNDGFCDRHFD